MTARRSHRRRRGRVAGARLAVPLRAASGVRGEAAAFALPRVAIRERYRIRPESAKPRGRQAAARSARWPAIRSEAFSASM